MTVVSGETGDLTLAFTIGELKLCDGVAWTEPSDVSGCCGALSINYQGTVSQPNEKVDGKAY